MKEYMDYTAEQIVSLCNIPSPTGFTKKIQEYVAREFAKLGYSASSTKKGSLLVDLGGEGEGLVLCAHVDTLGGIVRAVKSNGRLRLTKLGVFPEVYIESENCKVFTRTGKEYSGTIQLVNPGFHVNTGIADMKFNDSNIEVVLDEKVKNKEDVLNLEINSGDYISFDPRTVCTGNGFIKSRHLDDKAAVALLMSLAKMVKEKELKLNKRIYLLFTTYEEVGHGGSAGIPEGVGEMIAVDMGAVGEDLGTDEYKVSICAKDARGPYDYDTTTKLIELAKNAGLNYAVDIYPSYGSDADVALIAGYDIKHGLIGPGISASHGYERAHREGLENTLRLLAEYITY